MKIPSLLSPLEHLPHTPRIVSMQHPERIPDGYIIKRPFFPSDFD